MMKVATSVLFCMTQIAGALAGSLLEAVLIPGLHLGARMLLLSCWKPLACGTLTAAVICLDRSRAVCYQRVRCVVAGWARVKRTGKIRQKTFVAGSTKRKFRAKGGLRC